jgi:hypothetical protein
MEFHLQLLPNLRLNPKSTISWATATHLEEVGLPQRLAMAMAPVLPSHHRKRRSQPRLGQPLEAPPLRLPHQAEEPSIL